MSAGRGVVFVTWPGFDLDDEESAGLLRRNDFAVEFAPNHGDLPRKRLLAGLRHATAAIISVDTLDRDAIESAPSLRVIARTGVGVDKIDLEAATDAGIVVTTTPGANDQTCADHTLALMLACVRRIAEHDRSVRAHRWDRAGDMTPWDLSGSCVGLIGFGRIGRAVARRLTGFDVELLVCDPVSGTDEAPESVELDELLARADIVSLHSSLSPETRGMLGADELSKMKECSILINTARGELIDQDALVEGLGRGRPAGAGLDVFASEPPVGSALLDLPNVVLSPHIGGLSVNSIRAVTIAAAQSIVDLIQGRRPHAMANPDAYGRTPPTARTLWSAKTRPEG